MSGIMASVGILGQIAKSLVDLPEDASKKDIAVAIGNTVQGTNLITTDGSITKLVNKLMVEPVCIVTKGCLQEEVIQKVMELNTDIFCSYYLQAFEVLKSLYGVDTKTVIDLLGTDTGSMVGSTFKYGANKGLEWMVSSESIGCSEFDKLRYGNLTISLESNGQANIPDPIKQIIAESVRATQAQLGKGEDKSVVKETRNAKLDKMEDTLLTAALQRNLEINFTIDRLEASTGVKRTHSVVLPLTIKVHVIAVDTMDIVNMISPNGVDKSFSARYDEYLSGGIGFWDLWLANDLIVKYKDAKFQDKNKLLELLNSRTESANSKLISNNKIKGIGFEKFYNMFIMTADDKILIEKAVLGKLDDQKHVQEFFNKSGGLTLSVLDMDYEMLTLFTKDIRGVSKIGFKALKKRKENAGDYSEILKALLANRPPVF